MVGAPLSEDGSASGERRPFGKVRNVCATRKADRDCWKSMRTRPHVWREGLAARREPACGRQRGADEFGARYATGPLQ